MSVGMARSLFFLYAALNGIVFSAYLFAFSLEILWMVFGITALFFGIMALIGWFGNINFTKLRPFMLGGLVFLFFYWIFAMFIDLSAFDTIVSTVGIFLFLVLTAYDVKRYRRSTHTTARRLRWQPRHPSFPHCSFIWIFINLFCVYL